MTARHTIRLLLALFLMASPLQAFAAIPKLSAPPEGERWFGIEVGGARVGFAHLVIAKDGDGYKIDSDGSVRMRVMGFSREATSRESYRVGSDLAIRSFTTASTVDGNPILLQGEATPQGIRMTVTSKGSQQKKTLKVKGPVYPSQVLNVYPLMHAATRGKKYSVPMLDPESAKVKQVKIEVVGEEAVSGTPVVHLKNNLYPMVDNDIWVDPKGNTIKESVRDDLVLTLAEDEKTAKMHLTEDVLAGKDLVLDYSLIPVQPPIERPEQLKKLSVEFSGFPENLPLLQGKGQQAQRGQDKRVLFTMPNPAYAPTPSEAPTAADLAPTERITSDNPDIVAKKGELVGSEKDPMQVVKLLVTWVAKEIKGTVSDGQTALDTLKSGNGNCQGHTRLYAALARAAGIPTRFVSGVVYSPGRGFLYHCWAESYLNGWTPVDPTFGEVPANPTHIKMVEGDAPDDMAALAVVIGRVQAKVVEKEY